MTGDRSLEFGMGKAIALWDNQEDSLTHSEQKRLLWLKTPGFMQLAALFSSAGCLQRRFP
jgi:hypothetical protein